MITDAYRSLSAPVCVLILGIKSADSGVALGDGYVELGGVCLVVLLNGVGVVLDSHVGDVSLALEDLDGHLTGGAAKLVVVDGQGRYAAAGADALFAADDGNAGGKCDCVDRLRAVCCGVIGGDVENVVLGACACGNGGNVVGVSEGVNGDGEILCLKALLNDLCLVYGVGLAGAVEDPTVFASGKSSLTMSAC